MTTGISLVRENAESMQPPRTLWVSFPLGRPLGRPGDAGFQHRVIAAALDLLNRPSGPVLEDYPEDAPAAQADSAPACPVSFASRENTTGTWTARLADELSRIRPWYDLSRRRRRGRTLVGITGRTPEEDIRALGELLDEGRLPVDELNWFKHAIEDLKMLYLEGLTAQPGDHDPLQVHQIFWHHSILGTAFIEFYHRFSRADDRRLKLMARIIAPRDAVSRTAPEEMDQ